MIPPKTTGITAEDILEGERDVLHRLCNKVVRRNKSWIVIVSIECPDCGAKWHPATLRRFNGAQLEDRFTYSNVFRHVSGETLVEDVIGDKRFGRLVPSSEAHKFGKWSGKV